MIHHLQNRVMIVENRMTDLEHALGPSDLRREQGPVGPPAPGGEPGVVGPRDDYGMPGSVFLNPLELRTTTSPPIATVAVKKIHQDGEVSSNLKVSEGSGDVDGGQDEGHFDSEGIFGPFH
ncbi:uncharacterized protein [Branchiostoma lanceolatum]|uniref:uncharacterized protein n=1 Tax=Branchiostoma lanceolatum TaxID=7740 RepID=UPI0034558729